MGNISEIYVGTLQFPYTQLKNGKVQEKEVEEVVMTIDPNLQKGHISVISSSSFPVSFPSPQPTPKTNPSVASSLSELLKQASVVDKKDDKYNSEFRPASTI